MRTFFLLLMVVLTGGIACAQKKSNEMPPEDAQMRKIVATLRSGSLDAYVALFPTEEIIIGALEGDGWAAMEKSRQTPILQEKAKARFQSVLEQGAEMGIRWNIVSLTRFELTKARLSRDTLLERLAPVRFEGYLFVRDPLLRKTFGLRVTDVWEIAGELRGGLLSQVFPAVSVTDFEKHAVAQMAAEKKGEKYVALAPAPKEDEEDEDAEKAQAPVSPKNRIVAERRFYRGTFDKDLPVVLYVQGYKGTCPSGICSWSGTMRVGDEDWILVKVVRNNKQWTFTEVPENGVMDVTEQEGGGYQGTWNATDDKMGYEVQLQEQPPSKRLLREAEEFMDSVF
jgi:hypothetical protein